MTEFTIVELKKILRECAGVDESVDLNGDILDTEFPGLGYDSLAVLETVSRIERDYQVRLDEDAVSSASTPRGFLDLVNRALVSR